MKITLITGNPNKAVGAQRRLEPFGIQVDNQKYELVEPQHEDIEVIAKAKVKQAFELAKTPVVITDTGWGITALKGFPGPFMHYVTDWFAAQDFLNLMADKEDRSIKFMDVLAYKDEDELRIFKTFKDGIILTEAAGEGLPIDQIVTFRADKKSIALCNNEEISSFDEVSDRSVWTKFGEWYSSERS